MIIRDRIKGMETDSFRMTDQREYYTIDELLVILKVSRPTIYRALKAGLLKGDLVVNQWRIKPSEIDNFHLRSSERKLKRTMGRNARTKDNPKPKSFT